MKIEDISVWEAFCAVAKHGGFSAASQHTKIGVPQLSKRVAKLEEDLGTRLFHRSTRQVQLTEEGKALLPKILSCLEDLAGVEASFEKNHQRLQGVIRITSVPFVAQRFLVSAMSRFSTLHPEVRFEVELSENLVNIVEAGFDIAFRIHDRPPDSNLIYRMLLSNDLIACATPSYLKKQKLSIQHPKDLLKQKVLFLNVHESCTFGKSGIKVADLKKSQDVQCENGWFLVQLALNDFGVLIRSHWDVEEHLKNGKLVQILRNYPLGSFGNIYAVTSTRRLLAPRVSAFLDMVFKMQSKR